MQILSLPKNTVFLQLYDKFDSLTSDESLLQENSIEAFFPGRQSLHSIELFHYLMYLLSAIDMKDDPSKIEAFFQVLDDFDELSENDMVILIHIISFVKVKMVINHLKRM